MSHTAIVISAAVEGPTDEVALRRICQLAGANLGDVYGRSGKKILLSRLSGYNNSAQHRHWLVLADLDTDFDCAPDAVREWLPNPARLMCFRVAVRELEAWLLADAERIADYLRVPRELVPLYPEQLTDPKLQLINLARRSASRDVREDIVPDPNAGQSVGPAYTARIVEFVSNAEKGWRPEVAAQNAPSLQRCLNAVIALMARPFTV